MLLLALLPRDIRSDLIARLHRMSTEKAIEQDQVSEVGPTTAALEGQVRGAAPDRRESEEKHGCEVMETARNELGMLGWLECW